MFPDQRVRPLRPFGRRLQNKKLQWRLHRAAESEDIVLCFCVSFRTSFEDCILMAKWTLIYYTKWFVWPGFDVDSPCFKGSGMIFVICVCLRWHVLCGPHWEPLQEKKYIVSFFAVPCGCSVGHDLGYNLGFPLYRVQIKTKFPRCTINKTYVMMFC